MPMLRLNISKKKLLFISAADGAHTHRKHLCMKSLFRFIYANLHQNGFDKDMNRVVVKLRHLASSFLRANH